MLPGAPLDLAVHPGERRLREAIHGSDDAQGLTRGSLGDPIDVLERPAGETGLHVREPQPTPPAPWLQPVGLLLAHSPLDDGPCLVERMQLELAALRLLTHLVELGDQLRVSKPLLDVAVEGIGAEVGGGGHLLPVPAKGCGEAQESGRGEASEEDPAEGLARLVPVTAGADGLADAEPVSAW